MRDKSGEDDDWKPEMMIRGVGAQLLEQNLEMTNV